MVLTSARWQWAFATTSNWIFHLGNLVGREFNLMDKSLAALLGLRGFLLSGAESLDVAWCRAVGPAPFFRKWVATW